MSLFRIFSRGPIAAARVSLPFRKAGTSAWNLHDFSKPLTDVPQVEVDNKMHDLIVQDGTTIMINPKLEGKISPNYGIRLRHLLPPGVDDVDYARITGMLMWPTTAQQQLLKLERGSWHTLTKNEKIDTPDYEPPPSFSKKWREASLRKMERYRMQPLRNNYPERTLEEEIKIFDEDFPVDHSFDT